MMWKSWTEEDLVKISAMLRDGMFTLRAKDDDDELYNDKHVIWAVHMCAGRLYGVVLLHKGKHQFPVFYSNYELAQLVCGMEDTELTFELLFA